MRNLVPELLCVIGMAVACHGFGGDGPAKAGNKDAKKPAADADLKTLVEGNNEFAFDLYARLSKEKGNKFFSPYSISTALGVTYAGAGGNTAKEMAKTLHFRLGNDHLNPAFSDLIRKIQGAEKKRNYELAVANSLWGDKTGLSLDPNFLRLAQTDYQAEFHLVDFRKDPDGAHRAINGWVRDKTKNKIVGALPEGFVANDMRLMLVNAIHFKGNWFTEFPVAATKPDQFTIPGEPELKVPMMNHVFVANYTENADFQLAQFMYKDNEVSMVVILPKKMGGLAELEKKLTAKGLAQALGLATPKDLHVKLPKFKLTEEVSLKRELTNLGMKLAFISGAADFSVMEMKKTGISGDSLYLSEVRHKAFVEVDEKGTEAAAATAAGGARPVGPEPLPPHLFHANHPFMFLLRHNETGSILFMGRVFDPRSK